MPVCTPTKNESKLSRHFRVDLPSVKVQLYSGLRNCFVHNDSLEKLYHVWEALAKCWWQASKCICRNRIRYKQWQRFPRDSLVYHTRLSKGGLFSVTFHLLRGSFPGCYGKLFWGHGQHKHILANYFAASCPSTASTKLVLLSLVVPGRHIAILSKDYTFVDKIMRRAIFLRPSTSRFNHESP